MAQITAEPGTGKKFRRILSASTLNGNRVVNSKGEDIGKIDEIMIDVPTGRIGYAVLSFGGFLGMRDKLFAIPWNHLALDEDQHVFVLNLDKATLERAPGFDKNNWPDMSDREWGSRIYTFYGSEPYWDDRI